MVYTVRKEARKKKPQEALDINGPNPFPAWLSFGESHRCKLSEYSSYDEMVDCGYMPYGVCCEGHHHIMFEQGGHDVGMMLLIFLINSCAYTNYFKQYRGP
jgi:hypothetical protein